MSSELEVEIQKLLCSLANSLYERYPDYQINFTSKEGDIVTSWLYDIFAELKLLHESTN